MVITRFAPSPTGRLHLGHAFAARVAHDLARDRGGKFLLRFEDIDHTRVRTEFYRAIEDDLRFLGLSWDGTPWRQLDRLPHYRSALDTLKSLGVLYPCYCTRREIKAELESMTRAPHGPEGPLYPGTCRNRKGPPPDREPSWRLDTRKAANMTGPLTFFEESDGLTTVDPHLLGDVILARRDIGTSYHLAVVIDDAAQHISHVTRGRDLLHATHLHRLLQALLQLPEPHYHHHRLILDGNGQRLAKRHHALAIQTLREQNAEIWDHPALAEAFP
jgi:glutamyl-Q tRNA(Asp) synthetase